MDIFEIESNFVPNFELDIADIMDFMEDTDGMSSQTSTVAYGSDVQDEDKNKENQIENDIVIEQVEQNVVIEPVNEMFELEYDATDNDLMTLDVAAECMKNEILAKSAVHLKPNTCTDHADTPSPTTSTNTKASTSRFKLDVNTDELLSSADSEKTKKSTKWGSNILKGTLIT